MGGVEGGVGEVGVVEGGAVGWGGLGDDLGGCIAAWHAVARCLAALPPPPIYLAEGSAGALFPSQARVGIYTSANRVAWR